jgi:hypothetical protein
MDLLLAANSGKPACPTRLPGNHLETSEDNCLEKQE